MSIIRRAVYTVKSWLSGPNEFRLERDSDDGPDLVYKVQPSDEYVAVFRAKKNIRTGELRSPEIEYRLTSVWNYCNCIDSFIVSYHATELEELTHWCGENDVDDDHSWRWQKFLAENVIEHIHPDVTSIDLEEM